MAGIRGAWVKQLEGAGFQFRFLATPRIEGGELDKVRVLILPYSIAPSDGDARQIERFLDRGGMVIADWPRRLPHSLRAERCARRLARPRARRRQRPHGGAGAGRAAWKLSPASPKSRFARERWGVYTSRDSGLQRES